MLMIGNLKMIVASKMGLDKKKIKTKEATSTEVVFDTEKGEVEISRKGVIR